MLKYQAIRGTSDLLPDTAEKWTALESVSRDLFKLYGYREIRTPLIEPTPLFIRGIGDTTDIVQKQMFSFKDRGNRSISLRPEATASVIRAYLENHLDKRLGFCKLFYIGPMFRSERPQAGRSRQFHQIGVEAIGSDSAFLDAETITLLSKLLKDAGLKGFKIKLNSLGCQKDKSSYSQVLKKKLSTKTNQLCDDCCSRYARNVFRVLDCKNASCKAVVRSLPKMTDSLCDDCKKHFDTVCKTLKSLKVDFVLDPYLVRGLDYYTRTAFEVNHQKLGAQDAVAAGGRYDNLIADFGGPDTGAVGFAIGIERLIMGVGDTTSLKIGSGNADVYVVTHGEAAYKKGIEVVNSLRSKSISSDIDYQCKSIKAQMRVAAKTGCRYVVIIGEDELKKKEVGIKDMETGKQKSVKLNEAHTHLRTIK